MWRESWLNEIFGYKNNTHRSDHAEIFQQQLQPIHIHTSTLNEGGSSAVGFVRLKTVCLQMLGGRNRWVDTNRQTLVSGNSENLSHLLRDDQINSLCSHRYSCQIIPRSIPWSPGPGRGMSHLAVWTRRFKPPWRNPSSRCKRSIFSFFPVRLNLFLRAW